MASFRDYLNTEIKRLNAEKENAIKRKDELVRRIDDHVALLDERLDLATRLSDAYSRSYANPVFLQRRQRLSAVVPPEATIARATPSASAAEGASSALRPWEEDVT